MVDIHAYHTRMLWPVFVVEQMPGLNFSPHSALSIDKGDEISHKTDEIRHKLKLLKCIHM